MFARVDQWAYTTNSEVFAVICPNGYWTILAANEKRPSDNHLMGRILYIMFNVDCPEKEVPLFHEACEYLKGFGSEAEKVLKAKFIGKLQHDKVLWLLPGALLRAHSPRHWSEGVTANKLIWAKAGGYVASVFPEGRGNNWVCCLI
ncbi:MAG: hypothetical protein IT292_06665 [Deltaproteobacteria bacterium]|nr:hypothetical protein [Deltaproteobacteria bacterium]